MGPRRIGASAGLLVLVAASGAAADKFAGAFLESGAGARALAMGNAYTAVANDASAIYWNPAGLASTERHEFLASHEFKFGNLVDYSFLGGIYQVRQRNGRLALGIIRLGIDNIAFTDSSLWDDKNGNGVVDCLQPGDTGYDPNGGADNCEFSYNEVTDADKIRFENDSEYGIFLSYAQPAGSWHLGGSLKLIRQSVGEYSSFGFGLDFGLIRRDVFRNLDVGLALHDITGTYLSWSTGRKETIPPVPRLGVAYTIPSAALRGIFLLSSDIELHFDNRRTADQLWAGSTSANLSWGLEFSMQNRLALRIGLQEESFQAGAGLAAGPVHFDYGFVPDPRNDLDMSQRLAVRYVGP
jgi:hypothetical protein